MSWRYVLAGLGCIVEIVGIGLLMTLGIDVLKAAQSGRFTEIIGYTAPLGISMLAVLVVGTVLIIAGLRETGH